MILCTETMYVSLLIINFYVGCSVVSCHFGRDAAVEPSFTGLGEMTLESRSILIGHVHAVSLDADWLVQPSALDFMYSPYIPANELFKYNVEVFQCCVEVWPRVTPSHTAEGC